MCKFNVNFPWIEAIKCKKLSFNNFGLALNGCKRHFNFYYFVHQRIWSNISKFYFHFKWHKLIVRLMASKVSYPFWIEISYECLFYSKRIIKLGTEWGKYPYKNVVFCWLLNLSFPQIAIFISFPDTCSMLG